MVSSATRVVVLVCWTIILLAFVSLLTWSKKSPVLVSLFPADTLASESTLTHSELGLRLTTRHCVGPCCTMTQRNRSCLWHNLYYFGGVWYAVVSASTNEFSTNDSQCLTTGRPGIEGGGIFSPVLLHLSELSKLPSPATTRNMNGTTLLFNRFYPPNWGHGLLDEFYPSWLSACKLGVCSLDLPMRAVVLKNPNIPTTPYPRPLGVPIEGDLATFLGEKLEYEVLWRKDEWLVFDEVVVGAGSMTLSSPSTNYLMDTGRDSDAFRRLRDRFYMSHKLNPPKPRVHLPANRSLIVTLVKNKRHYTFPESLDNAVQLLRGHDFNAQQLVFSEIKSLYNQMKMYSSTDVLVTCIGTGATPTFLLPDGAAVVVIGSFQNPDGTFGYVEEPMFRSLYYLRVVYTGPEGILPLEQRLVDFVKKGAAMVTQGFKIPVDANENSSPIGIAAEYYTSRDPSLLQVVIGDISQDRGCWGRLERYICPKNPDGDKCISDKLNKTLLRESHVFAGLVCTHRENSKWRRQFRKIV